MFTPILMTLLFLCFRRMGETHKSSSSVLYSKARKCFNGFSGRISQFKSQFYYADHFVLKLAEIYITASEKFYFPSKCRNIFVPLFFFLFFVFYFLVRLIRRKSSMKNDRSLDFISVMVTSKHLFSFSVSPFVIFFYDPNILSCCKT